MVEPTNFTKPKFKSETENYDLLLEKGISLIQNLSGEKWTDFNYHDPGLTILEQLCYAITDLGYRNNFPIEDLLLGKKNQKDLEKTNLFFSIDKILPSAPLTPNDFKRIIIEHIDKVKNVWVHPVKDNKLGFHGLYNVFVQFEEGIVSEKSELEIKKSISELLMQNRTLGTDFQSVKILKKDTVSIDANINIDSFVLGETILAEIYSQIENILNPNIRFHDLEKMQENGKTLRDLFSGPSPVKGFIDSNDFSFKTNQIYISEIKEIIEKIEGVNEVIEIHLYKNGIKIFEDLITFDEDNYPYLKKSIINYNSDSEQIKMFRDNIKYELDTIILSQLYDSLSLSEKSNYYKTVKSRKKDITGRFLKNEIETYYSVQNEFPAVYGLKEKELSSQADNKRKAQVMQLRGFLILFEQLMANHLSQLANFHQFFSIEKKITNSYYTQYPSEIPDFKELISFNNRKEYLSFLKSISESENQFFKRRTQIIDHLLSRFGEYFDTGTLGKLMKIESEEISDIEVSDAILNTKIKYAENIIENGKNRCLGFNYTSNVWNSENTSGLEKRLKLLLDIKDTKTHSLVNPILDSYEKVEEENIWKLVELKIDKGPSIDVLTSKNNDAENLNFFTTSNQAFRSLFNYANKSKSYTIAEVKKKSTSKYHLLYNDPRIKSPIEVYTSRSEAKCKEAIGKAIKKFRELNTKCEGIYLIEHILLRPLLTSNYVTSFENEKGESCLVSYKSSSFESQNDLREDVYVLGSNRENYSIIKSETKKEFIVVLFDIFNKPVFKSPKVLYSNLGAKSEIKKLIEFFMKMKKEEKLIDEFSEILINKGNSHEFPSNFQYSNQLSFIVPDWPQRFQNSEFKTYFKKIIEEHIPAQFKYNINFLDINQVGIFEDVYFNWLDAKKGDDINKTDQYSLQLIQILRGYKLE
tara:strand:+ start:22382 stop:25147 length:2766 start_codon:yes stop_codon:yes gene_type:complete